VVTSRRLRRRVAIDRGRHDKTRGRRSRAAEREMRLHREGHGAPLDERIERTLDLAHKLLVGR
jgi:hypothetical protein